MAWVLVWLAFFLVGLVPSALAAPSITLKVDGRVVRPDVPARLVAGRVVVPVRAVAAALGAKVVWEPRGKVVRLRGQGGEVKAVVGSRTAWRGGVVYYLEVAPYIAGGRVLVPLRFFAEGLGAGVIWDGSRREVHILSGGYVPPAGEVWAYYYGRGAAEGLELAAPALTHVVIYSFTVDGYGNLLETTPYPEAASLARAKGLVASVLIFQDDPQVLANLVGNPEARQNFIRQTAELLRQRNYRGVNLDFERLPAEARTGYVQLVKALAATTRSQGKVLSLSLPAKESDAVAWQAGYDYARLGAAADRVVIMAYDQHHAGGLPGPVAGLDWAERVVRFAVSQIPREKLLLGLGAYGYDWPPWGKARALTLQQALSLAQGLGLTLKRDPVAAVPYFRYRDAAGLEHQVWYEDEESLARKAALAAKYGLKGVAVWRLGFPTAGFWREVARAFRLQGKA